MDNVTNEEIVLATMEVIGTIWNLIDLQRMLRDTGTEYYIVAQAA